MLTRGGGGAKPAVLFRAEAVAAHHELRWGKPIGLMPVSWSLISFFLLAMVTAAVVFLVTASYARKETARGILKPVGGEVRVLAAQGGTLRELNVTEGDVVAEGTPLARISRETQLAEGSSADEQVLASLAVEEATLRSRLSALESSAPFDDAGLAANLAALRADRASAQDTAQLASERQKLAEQRVAAGRPLVPQGLMAVEEFGRRQEAELALRQEVHVASARAQTLQAQIAELQARRAKLPFDVQQQRSQLEAALAGIVQRRAQAEGARGYELRAQAAGRITAVQAVVGQPLIASQPLMTLTPADAALVAEVYVPSRAIGFIKPGQAVRLLYDAFPYQRFGPAAGTVQAVSATVLYPQEVQAAMRIDEPVYRVVVQLAQQVMPAFGRSMNLSPGMALSADIVLEKRSFAEWLFEPILAMRGRL